MDKELQNLLEDVLKELKDLAIHLRGSNKAMKNGAKSAKDQISVRKQELKVLKDNVEARKKAGKTVKEFEAQIEETTDELEVLEKSSKSAAASFLSFPKKIIKAVMAPIKVMASTALGFTDISKPITSLTDAINQGIDEIPGIGKISLGLARDFDATRESFVALSKTGAGFNGNLLKLSKVAAEASIPLPKLVDLITKNSTILGAFFGTVQAGTNQFVSLGKGLRDMTERDLSRFGLTVDETSEFMMTFLEAERSRGNLQTFTNTQLIQGTKTYTENLAKLSAMTGKSIDVLNDEQMAANSDALFRAKLATMDKGTADIITKAYSQMGPGLQQLTKDMLAFEGPVSLIGREITAATSGDILKPLQMLINNAGNDDALRQFQNSVGSIGENLLKNGQPFADVAILTGDFAGVFAEFVPRIRKQLDERGLQGVLETLNTSGQKAVNVISQFDRLSANLQDMRLSTTLPATIGLVSGLSTKLGEMAKEGGFLDKFKDAITGVTEHIYKLLGVETSKNQGEGETKYKKEGRFDADIYTPGNQLFNTRGGKKPLRMRMADRAAEMGLNDVERTPTHNYDIGSAGTPSFYRGSGGFQNFGSGTLATLHGEEAVVPKNDIGQLASLLAEATATTKTTAGDTVTNNTTSIDMTKLNANTQQLIGLTEKTANHLNMLVTIGAMTEKNTKKTNNTLANLSGSLV